MFNPVTAVYFAFQRAQDLRTYAAYDDSEWGFWCGVASRLPRIGLVVACASTLLVVAANVSLSVPLITLIVVAWSIGGQVATDYRRQGVERRARRCVQQIETEFGPFALKQMIGACETLVLTEVERQYLDQSAEQMSHEPARYCELLEKAYLYLSVLRYQSSHVKHEARVTARINRQSHRRLEGALAALASQAA